MRRAALCLALAGLLAGLPGCAARRPAPQPQTEIPVPMQPMTPQAPAPPAGERGPSPYPGFRAPAVSGINVATGEEAGLGDLRGKIVLLNFFATWCLPCRKEMPIMERIALEMAGAVAVLAVGADSGEAPPKLAAFASSLGITFPVLYDQGEAALRYRVIGIPTSFFIDREGVVRARVEGPLEEPAIRKHVEAILGGGR